MHWSMLSINADLTDNAVLPITMYTLTFVHFVEMPHSASYWCVDGLSEGNIAHVYTYIEGILVLIHYTTVVHMKTEVGLSQLQQTTLDCWFIFITLTTCGLYQCNKDCNFVFETWCGFIQAQWSTTISLLQELQVEPCKHILNRCDIRNILFFLNISNSFYPSFLLCDYIYLSVAPAAFPPTLLFQSYTFDP